MTPQDAFRELVRRHTPPSLGWNLANAPVSVSDDALSVHDALPTTMHFACIKLVRASGLMTWTDEDHRDGGDFIAHRVVINDAELRALGLR